MLLESMFSVCVLMVTLVFLTGFLMMCCMELYDVMNTVYERTEFNQLRMIFENDVFVRRRSPISTAMNGKDKFSIGFWEYSEGEKKYLIYDFHLIKDSSKLGRFTRNCFNQDHLTGSESAVYCQRMIDNIINGIYSTPNQVKYQQDYSDFCNGEVSFEGELITVNLGDYYYVFE